MKMNKSRAEELLVPLKNGQAIGISPHWRDRMIEALEYIIENEKSPASVEVCVKCGCGRKNHPDHLCNSNFQWKSNIEDIPF